MRVLLRYGDEVTDIACEEILSAAICENKVINGVPYKYAMELEMHNFKQIRKYPDAREELVNSFIYIPCVNLADLISRSNAVDCIKELYRTGMFDFTINTDTFGIAVTETAMDDEDAEEERELVKTSSDNGFNSMLDATSM